MEVIIRYNGSTVEFDYVKLQEFLPFLRDYKKVPKKLVLQYYTSVSAGVFARETEKCIRRAVTGAQFRAMRENLDTLKKAYVAVKKGDRYSLTSSPEDGMALKINEKVLAEFTDDEFINAVFGIWLGKETTDKKFRKAVLAID